MTNPAGVKRGTPRPGPWKPGQNQSPQNQGYAGLQQGSQPQNQQWAGNQVVNSPPQQGGYHGQSYNQPPPPPGPYDSTQYGGQPDDESVINSKMKTLIIVLISATVMVFIMTIIIASGTDSGSSSSSGSTSTSPTEETLTRFASPSSSATTALPPPSTSTPAPVDPAPRSTAAPLPRAPEPEPDTGPGFNGKKAGDMAGFGGDSLNGKDILITATSLNQSTNFLDDPILCTQVTLKNTGGGTESFNLFDWDIQTPRGLIDSPTILGGDGDALVSGQLAPGGSVSGEVCFEADSRATPGEYLLIYDDSGFFISSRLVWVNNL